MVSLLGAQDELESHTVHPQSSDVSHYVQIGVSTEVSVPDRRQILSEHLSLDEVLAGHGAFMTQIVPIKESWHA